MVFERGASIFVGSFQELQFVEKADQLFPKISLSAREGGGFCSWWYRPGGQKWISGWKSG